MKKRIFTLLALGMLIGGVFSTLKAQNLGDFWFTEKGNKIIYERKDNPDKKSEPTNLPSRTKVTVRINSIPVGEKEATVYLKFNDTGNYLGFAESYTITELDTVNNWPKDVVITVKNDWNMPNTVNGTKAIVFASFDKTFPTATTKSDTVTCYNYPVFTVEYIAKTAQYKGSLRISNITGSNPKFYDNDTTNTEMWRYLEDKAYAHFRKDTTVLYSFTDTEVASITYGDRIVVHKGPQEYYLTIPGMKDPGTPGTVYRSVTIPVVEDAAINREQGVHHVPSTENFTLIITPTGSNTGKIPVVKTGRTTLPDSEGVTYEEIGNGSWLVTIMQVQTDINLSIDFITSNTDIESTSSVWANGGQLYVNALASGKASVYSITGALVKTISLSAGETASESLTTGFYVVTVNGKAYKVTIK